MSHRLINRSPDLKKLRDEGYDLEIRNGFLLVKDVPYVNSGKEVKRGILVAKLCLAGDVTTRPDDHVAYFAGEHPCYADGRELEKIKHGSSQQVLAEGVTVQHSFSAKPKPADNYEDYYAKVSTYAAIFGGQARQLDPDATAKTYPAIKAESEEESVFNYIDTASSRAEIGLITQKLAKKKIAIVGTGGTGAYVLDGVAKTPVDEIHLFDKDVFSQHNAFRAPGAPSIEELGEKLSKVAYLKRIYSKMHRGIVAHEAFLDGDNIEQLRGFDFVFLCLDRGSTKRVIVTKLEEFGIPFIDVGMGICETDGALSGILRVTTSTPDNRDAARERIPFSDGDGHNEYARNIQIAELNMVNAGFAILRWKKYCGFYHDLDQEYQTTFTINGNMLLNTKKEP